MPISELRRSFSPHRLSSSFLLPLSFPAIAVRQPLRTWKFCSIGSMRTRSSRRHCGRFPATSVTGEVTVPRPVNVAAASEHKMSNFATLAGSIFCFAAARTPLAAITARSLTRLPSDKTCLWGAWFVRDNKTTFCTLATQPEPAASPGIAAASNWMRRVCF